MALPAATRARLQIHLCVLFWGATAILGKLISLPAFALVWWRMTLAAALLALVPRFWRGALPLPARLLGAYGAVGVLLALHWVSFYAAIRLSNASVGATCMALVAVFTAMVEPFIARRPFCKRDFTLGVAILPGVWLMTGGVPRQMHAGVAVGVLSALLAALLGAWNKKLTAHADPVAVTGIELAAGALFLTVTAPLFPALSGTVFVLPGGRDCVLLFVLSLFCTLLPFVLWLGAMRHLSAFSAQLLINLEPVYTVLLAVFLFQEQRQLTPLFYAGGALILAVVALQPFRSGPAVRPSATSPAGEPAAGPTLI